MNDIGEKLGTIEELNIYPECVEMYLYWYTLKENSHPQNVDIEKVENQV